ncbi:MAG: hypothetical protein JWN39_865 [Ilumatobacteraceae bacterium]|nr:hypothetical protein [Ilumatobacteraceae bacterium]
MSSEVNTGGFARFPPVDILAIVPIGDVPQRAPAAIAAWVEPVTETGLVVDWTMSARQLLEPGATASFWAWQRTWAQTWSLGPATNVRALVQTCARHGHEIHPSLQPIVVQLSDDQQVLGPLAVLDAGTVADQIGMLETTLLQLPSSERGVEIFDETFAGRPPRRLCTWAAGDDEVVLSASDAITVSVTLHEGLVVRHGRRQGETFAEVANLDLTGDTVRVTNSSGGELLLSPTAARPLSWLAPSSLRSSVHSVPIAAAWTPLFVDLPAALAAAERSGTVVRLSRFVV